MERNLQQQIAFYLTGRRSGRDLLPLDENCRPVLFARFADLTSLRYDFPVVLDREGGAERSLVSLSSLVDDAVAGMPDTPDRDRVARHGHRIEREIRKDMTSEGGADLATTWNRAVDRIAGTEGELVTQSAKDLWKRFGASGEIVDADQSMPAKAIAHAWSAVEAKKAAAFRQKAERLLLKLRDVLAAEIVGSAAGRTPERLMAGVGSAFAASFDFQALSSILVASKPEVALSDQRRARIEGLIDVLERQRFYPIGDTPAAAYNFRFDRCSDALDAYNARRQEAVELTKALAIAELEAFGDYRESIHDILFDGFGQNGLDPGELAQMPNYLVSTAADQLDPAESARVLEILGSGLPFKVLVQTDDALEPSTVAEGHAALGLRARQMVNTAIGLTDIFVFQASSSQLVCKQVSLLRGLTYDGPALFSIYSGAGGHTGEIPVYLVAAAAVESRVFPSLVYDPSGGADWASRLCVDDNPRPDDDWPVHTFTYEDDSLQASAESTAFTLADFMAMDNRFHEHFAVIPAADWSDSMITVPEAQQRAASSVPDHVPAITLVNGDGRLQKAIVDDRTLLEVRRCLNMWHSLQELGGIHNSHAERLLAQERRSLATAASAAVTDAVPTVPAQTTPAEPAAKEEAVTPEPIIEDHGDDPYIETERCTSCNECTQINNRMFAYNELKQAYVADESAGTYRQLVEAAEGCQVSIIHPGKPKNPKEPGLEDLIKRAAPFI